MVPVKFLKVMVCFCSVCSQNPMKHSYVAKVFLSKHFSLLMSDNSALMCWETILHRFLVGLHNLGGETLPIVLDYPFKGVNTENSLGTQSWSKRQACLLPSAIKMSLLAYLVPVIKDSGSLSSELLSY